MHYIKEQLCSIFYVLRTKSCFADEKNHMQEDEQTDSLVKYLNYLEISWFSHFSFLPVRLVFLQENC